MIYAWDSDNVYLMENGFLLNAYLIIKTLKGLRWFVPWIQYRMFINCSLDIIIIEYIIFVFYSRMVNACLSIEFLLVYL